MTKDSSWLHRHFAQDASVLGTLLAFGLSTLAIVAAFAIWPDRDNDAIFALAVGALPIVFLPGPIVLGARLIRRERRQSARCDGCGARSAAEVRYLQVTGIVVVALMKEAKMHACATCSHDAYVKTTAHTGLFGWWMPVTALVVPWVVLANTLAWIKSRAMLTGARGVAGVLDAERDYARNLLRTKDTETVVEVLAQRSGVSPADVRAWLTSIH